ncbi:iron chelate uptake ABC transporter family permease subunit, partial [Turicibacter sanguinis]|nr:iron chelate uptake ABC transporter family permease subunit [Turicibacter sanguinis]
MQTNKRKLLILLAIPLVVLIICIGTIIGSSNIDFLDILSIIGHKLVNLPLLENIQNKDVSIIWVIRLPRVLLAFLVGASLAVSGAVIQSILKNPLASPYTLGVSSGASLGVGLYIILGFSIPLVGNMALPVIGFICGLATVFSVILFANKVDRGLSNNTMILAGMVFSLFTNAMLTTITALNSENITQITMWQMGSFAMRGWPYVRAIIPFFIVGLFIVLKYCKEMDVLSF